jgi:hypothetical protein
MGVDDAPSRATPQTASSTVWVTDSVMPSVVVSVRSPQPVSRGATVVDRLWLQTWLTESFRQDRAVFRLRTEQTHLTFRLPSGASPTDVRAEVDGSEAEHRALVGDRIDVDVARASADGWHQVVIESNAPCEGALGLTAELDPVRLDDNPQLRQVYWELHVPSQHHLLGHSGGFHDESIWGWRGLGWTRGSVLTPSDLATWSGGGSGWEAASTRNRYLFSSFGDLPVLRLHTIRRSLLVLTAAGLAMGAGLLWIRFPALRCASVVYGLMVALMGLAIAFPGPAILTAQAAAVGVVLAVLAALLERRRRADLETAEQDAVVQLPSMMSQTYGQPAAPTGSSATTKIAAPGALRE